METENVVSMHEFLAEDFSRLDADVVARCTNIDGKRLYLSGATGFFGKNLLALFSYLQGRGASFEVTALSRAPERFLADQPWCRGQAWLNWCEGDALNPWPGEGRYDLVLHAATDTAAAAHVDKLAIFDAIVSGTREALAFATSRGVQRLLLCGSGAQYGDIPETYVMGVPESSAIACDPANTASAYGEAKRASEALAALHAQRHGYAVINTRCFAFVGPGLVLDGHFAIGNFLRAALCGKAIELSSQGTAVRSYLYGADLAVWLLSLLLNAPPGTTVNVGSGQKISVLQLATRVRDLIDPNLPIKTGEGTLGEGRHHYLPSIARAQSLGLNVWTDLDQSITRTAQWHRQRMPHRNTFLTQQPRGNL